MAERYCPQVLTPPFVNGGILALKGTFLNPDLLRSMVREALDDPLEGSFEQTIIATAVHQGAGLLPESLCPGGIRRFPVVPAAKHGSRGLLCAALRELDPASAVPRCLAITPADRMEMELKGVPVAHSMTRIAAFVARRLRRWPPGNLHGCCGVGHGKGHSAHPIT